MYPKSLSAVKAYMGEVPYGVEKVDPRTADKRLIQMTPQDIQTLALTNPVAAETAAQRLMQLDAKAAATPSLPGADDYEGD